MVERGCETVSRTRARLAEDRMQEFPLVVRLSEAVMHLIVLSEYSYIIVFRIEIHKTVIYTIMYYKQNKNLGFPVFLCFSNLYGNR